MGHSPLYRIRVKNDMCMFIVYVYNLCGVMVLNNFDFHAKASVLLRTEDLVRTLGTLADNERIEHTVSEDCAPATVQERRGKSPHIFYALMGVNFSVYLYCNKTRFPNMNFYGGVW